MDSATAVPEVLGSQRSGDVGGDVVVEHGLYTVKEMRLDLKKLATLWLTISKFRTLFSDLTRGDLDNFLRFVTRGHSIWLEIYERDNFVGIICLTHLEKVIDTEAHVIFFDHVLADKVELCKRVVKWAFKRLPLQRMSVDVPRFYYATVRLVREIGFKQEGERRNAALIGGRWANIYLFGITRQEAAAL